MPQRHCGTTFHLPAAWSRFLRALPRTLTVTATGRPRYDASENGAPFSSAREKSGARSVPAATWAAGTLRAPDFSLADENGAPFSLASYRGRPVAVSVNVRGNARKNLLQAAGKWNVVPQWRWGIGSEAQLARVWKRYHVGVLVTSKKVAGVVVHDVVHTEASYVIDAAGYQRAIFLWPYSAEAVTRTLNQLAVSYTHLRAH